MIKFIAYVISFATYSYATFLCLAPCSEKKTWLLQPLYGPSIASGGVVQFCLNNTKYLVCDYGWDYRDSSVLCQYLGYSPNGMN